MRKDFITFRSITPAQRAQYFLRRIGVETVLQRTPVFLRERGCSYCLRLDSKDTDRAAAMLDDAGITYNRIYKGGEIMP